MRTSIIRSSVLRLVTALALVASQSAMAAPGNLNADAAVTVPSVDVALSGGGVLHGYVVDGSGVPAAGVEVKLLSPAGESVAATSDDKGRFGFRGLDGAAYQLETEHGVVTCRAWTAKAAPPRSAATLLLVHDSELVRGQYAAPAGLNNSVVRLKRAMTNPFFVATVIGAAVAIPVAVHNSNQDNSSS